MQIALQSFYLHLLFCEGFLLLGIYFAKPRVVSHFFIALLHAQVGVAENLALKNVIWLMGGNNLVCCAWLCGLWEVVWVGSSFSFFFCRAVERDLVLLVAVKLEVGSGELVEVADDSIVLFANLLGSNNASLL